MNLDQAKGVWDGKARCLGIELGTRLDAKGCRPASPIGRVVTVLVWWKGLEWRELYFVPKDATVEELKESRHNLLHRAARELKGITWRK